MKKYGVVCMLFVLGVSLTCPAALWFGNRSADPDYWDIGSNWDTGLEPTSADGVGLISEDGLTTTTVRYAGEQASFIQVGQWAFNATLNIESGASLSTAAHMAVSWDHNGESTVNVNGSLSVGNVLYVGSADTTTHAQLTVDGGSVSTPNFNLNSNGYSGGEVDLYDGSIVCDVLAIGNPNAGQASLTLHGGTITINSGIGLAGVAVVNPHFDFSGGTLLVAGDYTETGNGAFPAWVGGGYAVSGTGETIVWDYNETNPGYTTVTTIPEPATMVILGLGSLILRRKK